MPYMTEEYQEKLKGKTVQKIEGDKSGFKIYWTDGTFTKFVAWVEHEKITRDVTIVVNSGPTLYLPE
jgi:hypothetical protein